MIRKKAQCRVENREQMRGGPGSVEIVHFVNKEELYDKGRLFGKITLKPHCGIGYHVHEKESEILYILKGAAVYNDNGKDIEVTAGDVTICKAGEGHSITNDNEDIVELAALVIKE